MSILVAVYGTLKKGFSNHGLLSGSRYIADTLLEGFDMYNLGPFPGVVRGEGVIHVELYEVSQETLEDLDLLEGYCPLNPKEGLYDREVVDTPLGEAYIYTFNGGIGPRQEKVCALGGAANWWG